jgi:hypothetical protein
MKKAFITAVIALAAVANASIPARAAEPDHKMIDFKFFKCEKSRDLRGGIYGKGPFKWFGQSKSECSKEEWVEITKDEFKTLAAEWYGYDWSKEIPFWNEPPSAIAADYQVAEAYSGLRNMVLSTKPESIGLKLTEPSELWGVVMETGYPESVASLVALADGTVSLYFSNGGDIIGLGSQEGPQRVAQSFLASSRQLTKQMQPTKIYPLPKPSYTRFYLLTASEVLTAETKEDDLGYNRHSLSPLFHKGHELISEIRAVDQKLRAGQGARPAATEPRR